MFEAWENELFDKYNGEARETEEEFWARVFDDVESLPSRYWEPGCEEVYYAPELNFVDEALPFN